MGNIFDSNDALLSKDVLDTEVLNDGIAEKGEKGSKNKLKWKLLFKGVAEDKEYTIGDGNVYTRQAATGTLHIIEISSDRNISTFEAVSGPMGNGLLPNGEYKSLKPILNGNFSDETGLTYKMVLNPMPSVKNINRTDFRIHPVVYYWSSGGGENKKYTTGETEGCVGLVGNKNAAPFLDYMKEYFKNNDYILLEVNIDGNANIREQITKKLHY